MPPPLRVLLVEDHDADADSAAAELAAAGFAVQVTRVRSLAEMEAVAHLAVGVAHDFNNVLTAILGHAELLLDQVPPEDSRRVDLEEIRRLAERAVRLTRQLLDVSRK